MKIRHWIFGLAMSTLVVGTSGAVTTVSNTTNNTNNMQGVGNTSFNFSSENTTISQTNTDDEFCQFFKTTSGSFTIVQIIFGNAMTQLFGVAAEAATDPCQ